LARAGECAAVCATAYRLTVAARAINAKASSTSVSRVTVAVTAANANSHFTNHQQESTMNMTLTAGPLISLIAGILILVMPKLLNYIVAIYLIAIGLLGLFGGNINFR